MSAADRIRPFLSRFGLQFKAEPRTVLFTEMAVDRWLNMFTSLADPDEVLKKAGVTRPMLRVLTGDDEISTAMDTRREALLAVPWRLELAGGGSGTIPEPVQWLWGELEKHAESALGGCMEALAYGYSVQEVMYKPADKGRITWAAIVEKPFEWFIPQRDGTVLYRSAQKPSGEEVDSRKFLLTVRRPNVYRNPYGEALFSRLYWPWFFRSQGWRFWARWLERFGTPLLIGKTAGDAAAMADALARVVQSATIAVGNGDDVVIAENKGGAGHFEGFERACCARIQKMVLGQTLTTDAGGSSGKSGSYALGQVHNEVRRDRRDADVRMVRRSMQQLVNTLWELNFTGPAPSFVMADDTGLEAERAERDVNTTKAGLRLKPSYWTRVYDYEPEDIDEEAMNAPPPSAPALPGSAGNKPTKLSVLFAGGPRFTPEQEVIERGIDEVLGNLGDAIADAEIKAVIRTSVSPVDLVERVATLLEGAPAEQFRVTLERALFAADILGYAHAATQLA